jgi:transposase
VKVASEPNALLAVLKNPAYHFKRIGLEAGPLSQWLFSALAEADLPVICVETHVVPQYSKLQANQELRKMLNIGGQRERPETDLSRLSDAELIQQLADQAKELGIDLNYSFYKREE